jgi:hypothetical protein
MATLVFLAALAKRFPASAGGGNPTVAFLPNRPPSVPLLPWWEKVPRRGG